MKRMKFPLSLKVLDVQLASLRRGFIDSLKQNVLNLEELTITFAKVDMTETEEN